MITLANQHAAELEVIPRGAIIRALRVPDRNGVVGDVVLGFDTAEDYVGDRWYIGALIGRCANRIRDGRFSIDQRSFQLSTNDGQHHLHGGPAGFHTRRWHVAEVASSSVRLSRTSPDGEEGYPGTVQVEVTYTLTKDNELIVDYYAVTDQPTPINLTQHSYFNLGGSACADIRKHELTIDADYFLPAGADGIPVGVLEPVSNGPLDFTEPRVIGRAYDHCFVLRKRAGELARAALLSDPQSQRTLTVLTTEPGLQLYTGQYLEPMAGKAGRQYQAYSGVCLETQHFPDSPNEPAFPSVILRPGREFRSRTIYRFGVQD